MAFAISPFTIDMYEGVITLWKQTEGIGLSEADSRDNIRSYLKRNPSMSFVVKDKEGNILAAALCGHDGRRGYIHHLEVRQGFRRQGIGVSSFKNVYLVCKPSLFTNATFSSIITILQGLTFGKACAGYSEKTSGSYRKTYENCIYPQV